MSLSTGASGHGFEIHVNGFKNKSIGKSIIDQFCLSNFLLKKKKIPFDFGKIVWNLIDFFMCMRKFETMVGKRNKRYEVSH